MDTPVLIKRVLMGMVSFACVSAFAQTTISVNCAKTPVPDDLHTAIATANANSTSTNLYTLNISGTCYANAGSTPGTFTITAPMTLQQDPAASTPAVLDGSALNSLSATKVLVNNATGVNLIGLAVQKGVGSVSHPLYYAGGITNTGNLNIIKSIIRDNQGSPTGTSGGIQNYGNISIQQSLIAYNTALGGGGGLRDDGIRTIITTSTFYKNVSDSGGGAIIAASPDGTISIYQSTITGNSAFSAGALAIRNNPSLVDISQSIIANNIATSGDPRYNNYDDAIPNRDDASKLVTDADAAAYLGIPIVNGVPTLADNGGPTPTLKLGPGSLGVNAIALFNANCSPPTDSTLTLNPATDQRGAPRPGVGKAGCDVGAYETGDARLIATPNPVDFVSTPVGNTSTLGVHISNTGNSVATISSVAPTPPFGIASALGTSSLNPLNATDMQLSFTPATSGSKSGNLTLTYPGVSAPTLTLSVPLMGTGEAISPSQLMKDIQSYFNQGVANSTIVGIGKNTSIAKRRLDMFSDLLKNADKAIVKNKLEGACQKLKTAAKRSNGQPKPPDYITGTDVPTINQWIGNLMTTLNCPAIKHEDGDDDKDDDAGNVKDH